MSKYCFLDRDGTIITDRHYLDNISDIEIIFSSINGMKQFLDNGFKLIIISNQSGIGRGFTTKKKQDQINKKIKEIFSTFNVEISKFFYCHHSPVVNCYCRKPNIGMFNQVELEFGSIDKSQSIMIGDKISDVQAGLKFGILSYHVKTGLYPSTKEIEKLNVKSFNNISDIAEKHFE